MREGPAHFFVDASGGIALLSAAANRVLSDAAVTRPATAEEVFGVAVDRLREGARDGIRVPTLLGFVDVVDLVDRAGEPAGLLVTAEDEALRRARFAPSRNLTMDVVRGSDPSVGAAIDLAERYARTLLPILIVAERGAGGLRLARWIRAVAEQESGRSLELDGKLLTADFEADPAVAALAAQESGQLLVRAIDEAPRAAQDALARAFRGPLTHLRLIAWSRTDPRSRDAVWSPELVRLLRVTTVALPPLRERTDRILVAETMLGALAPDRSLSAAAQRVIERHTFPGNLTELEIVLQRARAHAGHRRVLEPEDLPTDLLQGGRDVDVTRRGAERAALEEALRAAKGNLSVAAKRLGVARTTLYRMIERHEDDALRVLLAGGARQRAPRTGG